METEYEPVINNWYQNQDKQLHFYIIDIDEPNEIIEIEHANGDIDTMDIDQWYESGLELASEPEHQSWLADDSMGIYPDIDPVDTDLQPDAIEERFILGERQDDSGMSEAI